MSDNPISVDEFRKRLVALCLTPGSGVPRKQRDRHILFKGIVLRLDRESVLSEKELDAGLQSWLSEVERAPETDHVTLRRHMVDEGYLVRDAAGSVYTSGDSNTAPPFAAEIKELDSRAILDEARRGIEARRRCYRNQSAD